jgi:hypothetical protein
MRRPSLPRGLSAFLLALYLGAGFGVPLADGAVFHSGRTGNPSAPSLETDQQGRAAHDFCRLAEHSPDSVAPVALDPTVVVAIIHVAESALTLSAPRDAAPAGLPASRAPPLA